MFAVRVVSGAVYCTVNCVPRENAPGKVVDTALRAAEAVGGGLYGVDLKEVNGRVAVIEVNDNPCLESGEDDFYPDVYERIITHLMG